MNKVERLLKKLCPNGVEWEKIDKIFDLKNGYTPSKNNTEFWTNGTIPWFRLEDIRQNGRILDNAIQSVSHNALKGGKVIPANSLILSTTATIGEVALITVPFICNQQLTAISINSEYKNSVNIKFYFYYFQILGNKMKKGISTGSFPIISVSKLKKLKIPIPPLEIQEEIVKILDKFTDYVTELTTELTLRQKQYHYYRDELFTFENEEVEWKRFDEVCEIIRGNGLQKKDFVSEGVPCIHYGQIYTYYGITANETKSFVSNTVSEKLKKASSGDIILATTSENIEDVGKSLVWLGEEEVCIGGHSCILKTNQNSEYINHYLRTTQFQKQKERLVIGTKVIELYPKKIGTILIPIPSPETQLRISEILNGFDNLCNSFGEGLPKEIELRQKQYEFYRNKLLSFD